MSDQLQFAMDPAAALDAHINHVLFGKLDVPLTAELRELLLILRWHKGASHARPLSEIAAKLHLSNRQVKQAVKTLIQQHGIPIGGSRQEPIGYFLLVTREDWTHALSPLVSEIRSLRARVDALKTSPFFSMVCGQTEFELGDERKAV